MTCSYLFLSFFKFKIDMARTAVSNEDKKTSQSLFMRLISEKQGYPRIPSGVILNQGHIDDDETETESDSDDEIVEISEVVTVPELIDLARSTTPSSPEEIDLTRSPSPPNEEELVQWEEKKKRNRQQLASCSSSSSSSSSRPKTPPSPIILLDEGNPIQKKQRVEEPVISRDYAGEPWPISWNDKDFWDKVLDDGLFIGEFGGDPYATESESEDEEE